MSKLTHRELATGLACGTVLVLGRLHRRRMSGVAAPVVDVVPGQTGSAPIRRIIGTVAALLFSIALVFMSTGGAQAVFSGQASSPMTTSAGTVDIAIGSSGTSGNRLSVTVSNIGPGGSAQRAVNVQNAGTVDWSSLAMLVVPTSSSLLDTDTTNGLQVTVEGCSQAWTEAGTTPNFSYTCGGASSVLVNAAPVSGSKVVSGGVLTAGDTGYYKITIALPASAPDTMQGLSSSFSVGFTGTQRAGVAK